MIFSFRVATPLPIQPSRTPSAPVGVKRMSISISLISVVRAGQLAGLAAICSIFRL